MQKLGVYLMRPSDLFSIPTTTVKKSNFFGDNFGITTDSIIQGNLRSVPPLSAYHFQQTTSEFSVSIQYLVQTALSKIVLGLFTKRSIWFKLRLPYPPTSPLE